MEKTIMQPKISKFYTGDWKHDPSDGVGLKLIGYPNNLDAFLDLMHEQSCNPVAARRILEELKKNGFKLTTLMFNLDFNYIGEQLELLGMKMEVIEPTTPNQVNNGFTDNIAFDIVTKKTDINAVKFESEQQKLEALNKANDFNTSLESFQHDFGPYDKNPEISQKAIDNYKKRFSI